KTASPSVSFLPKRRVFTSSLNPHISRNGKYAFFISTAKNITTDKTPVNEIKWIYRKDIEGGEVRRIPGIMSGNTNLYEYPASMATNADGSILVINSIIVGPNDKNCDSCQSELGIYDASTNTTTLLDTGVEGTKYIPNISDD